VVLTEDDSPRAYLLNDVKIVGSRDDRFASFSEILEKLDEPQLATRV
jgi:hypothetical protein